MSIMKDFELDKYSTGLVSHRKSLIKSDYKTTNEKRLNYPFTDFEHWDKFSKTGNSSNSNNNNGDSKSLCHIKLPERHVFTASTASLIVHVPSLSYVSEDIDDDLSDHEISKLNLNLNNNNNKNHNRICPICNTIYIDLQQQFDDFHLKRFFSLSSMNVNMDGTTTTSTITTTNNNNYDNSSITIPRLWDILDIFSTNSSKNFCPFHKSLSLHYSTFSSTTHNNHNNISSTLTNSLSLPCLSNFDEQLTMLSTRSNENTILHSNNNDNNNNNHNNVIYNRNINNTPSISIEYADNISMTTNNSQEQIINNQLSGETKSKCELWLKTC
ncbi:uncharacterized protein DC041_0000406 [Schistosoma bovis]|uniref:Uncharacterized protein n=1 Tax=Schistosoma bovis TaxID=6184 RepID=A0A430QH28_SCHBO|nr:uncharacterized protein DC041_0000406 [Schistosoma bovis]